MKQSNWSLLGYVCSLIYGVVTIYQYWIKFPDTSQFLMNIVLAILIFAVSWLYSLAMKLNNTLNGIEDYLANKPKFKQEEK